MATTVGIRGGLSIDHLILAGHHCQFNVLGGPGLYGALGARLIEGVAPRLNATLPDVDPRFQDLFDGLGVDTSTCPTTATIPRVWILNSPEGRRIVSTAPPGDVELEGGLALESENDASPVPEGFYVDLRGLLESSPQMRPKVSSGTIVGIDPHQLPLQQEGVNYLRRVSPDGAIVLPSRVQLRLIHNDPRRAARLLADELNRPVVARLDRDGMYVVRGGEIWTLNDEAISVIETTGAGDSSAAAIIAALALGHDIITAAAYGISVARLALSAWGPDGLLRSAPLTSPLNHIQITREA